MTMKTWLLLATAALLGCATGARVSTTHTVADGDAPGKYAEGRKYAEREVHRIYGSGEKQREVVYDPNDSGRTFKVLDSRKGAVDVRTYRLHDVVVCLPPSGREMQDGPPLPGYPPGCKKLRSVPEGAIEFDGEDPCRVTMTGDLKCW
jgi:hypothetical protein